MATWLKVFFLALIGKLSTSWIILSAAKKKKSHSPHLYPSSRYSRLMLLYELIVRSFLKKNLLYIKIYVFKGANQPWAGHVTGHADSKIISDFLKILNICRCYTEFLTSVIMMIYWWNKQSCRFWRTRSAILPIMAWGGKKDSFVSFLYTA